MGRVVCSIYGKIQGIYHGMIPSSSPIKGGPLPPYSTTHQGQELHHKGIIPKGLGPSYLVDLVWERCEGEYGEELDLSVSPQACTLMNTCASTELFAKVSVRCSCGIKSFE
jgi:hypothetical protein